jgi:hypothetical protein
MTSQALVQTPTSPERHTPPITARYVVQTEAARSQVLMTGRREENKLIGTTAKPRHSSAVAALLFEQVAKDSCPRPRQV